MTDVSPIVAIVVAIIGVLGGLSGFAALYTALTTAHATAKKTEIEALSLIVESVQEENQRLRGIVGELEELVARLQKTIARYRSGINRLVHQIEETGLTPVWRPENDDTEA